MLESGIRCTGEIVIAVLLRAHVRLSSPEVLAGISFKIYIYIYLAFYLLCASILAKLARNAAFREALISIESYVLPNSSS